MFNGLFAAGLAVGVVSICVTVNALSNLVIALTLVSEGIAAFLVWRQGYRAARFYLLSWVLFLLAGLAYVLSNLNYLSGLVVPESTVKVATVVGVLFWSLAIADRINLLKAETESAKRRLERSERKYRSLFESSRDAIFITTSAGQIVDLNPAGIALFGFNPTELSEINARQVYAEPAAREQIAQAIASQGFVQDYPLRMRRNDGTELDAMITSSTWQDDETDESGFQGIIRDVTEHLRTEAELAQHRNHLEELGQTMWMACARSRWRWPMRATGSPRCTSASAASCAPAPRALPRSSGRKPAPATKWAVVRLSSHVPLALRYVCYSAVPVVGDLAHLRFHDFDFDLWASGWFDQTGNVAWKGFHVIHYDGRCDGAKGLELDGWNDAAGPGQVEVVP